jgi:tRNA(Ile2) C34 agmatinyltransferase TiaS
MMRIYVGFDDTDNIRADRGTGKLARWFENELPEGCRMEGVVRQQLLLDERIPYTSHNSSACVMVHAPDASWAPLLTARAIEHLKRHSLEGSDPGLCVASESDGDLARLIAFGRACTATIATQKEAMEAASSSHLSGHGGSNDGIIGAAAAVGLTASGWSGRFIEYGRLREIPDPVRVSELERWNIVVVSGDRDARVPAPEDIVCTKGWLRPRLWGKRAVLLVTPRDGGVWESLGERRNKSKESPEVTKPAS